MEKYKDTFPVQIYKYILHFKVMDVKWFKKVTKILT